MRIYLLICLSLLSYLPSALADEGPLRSAITGLIVIVDEDGKEQLTDASLAAPGSVIEYQLLYENISSDALGGLVVTGPIPAGAEFVQGTARSDTESLLLVSLDQGDTWNEEPVMRRVTNDDGITRDEVVPASEYTHIKWTETEVLAANSAVEYFYRVRIRTE